MTQPAKRVPALIAIPREGDRGTPSPPSSSATLPPLTAQHAELPMDARLQGSSSSTNGGSGNGGGVILRIKRKRGTEPVDALRIGLLLGEESDEADEQVVSAGGSKRRIVEKSKEGSGDNSGSVFRLAETVSLDSFSDPKLAFGLSSRLAARYPTNSKDVAARAPSPVPSAPPAATAARAPPPSAISQPAPTQPQLASSSTTAAPSSNAASPSLRFQVVRPAGGLGYGAFAPPRGARKSLVGVGSEAGGVKMGKARAEGKLRRSTSSASLSSVKSHSSMRSRPPSRLRIIDAVAVQQGERRRRKQRQVVAPQAGIEDADVEMKSLDRRFADMLTDYLADKDLVAPSDIYNVPLTAASSGSSASESDEDESDYVYDVYYRDSAPTPLGLSGLADSGMHPLPVPGHAPTPTQTGAVVPAELATLEGLRAADLEIDDANDDALDLIGVGSGEEEWDEGEDEDSNDEGFYRNDYPDQEALDSDEETFGWDGKGDGDSEDEDDDDGSSF